METMLNQGQGREKKKKRGKKRRRNLDKLLFGLAPK